MTEENENTKPLLWFNEIHKEDIPIVGGKGANLGEMTNANFPVPNGFVVTAQAYFAFIAENNLMQKIKDKVRQVNFDSTENLNQASLELKNLILNGKMSKELASAIRIAYGKLSENALYDGKKELGFVAVRSSATAEDLPGASFAGQQETFLNIKGPDAVVDAVKKCWASLFTARAIYYRYKNNFDTEKVGLAAVVQKMVESEKSGIMFTVNPANEEYNELVIEACYGLGEAIVSGSINPDHYVINKEEITLKQKILGNQDWQLIRAKDGSNQRKPIAGNERGKQKISEEQIIELATIGKKIEEHYKFPQDIEWAVEKEKLFIVQSRPITTLKKQKPLFEEEKIMETRKKWKDEQTIIIQPKKKTQEKIDEDLLLTGLPASPGIASGNVKIILDMKELGKIEKGDIMVSSMTNPDMVPAMERAAGIITDEGGSTSHAAIVSRELGIPCVVGTEKATKILRENQEVTVDGTQGKVFRGKLEKKAEPKKEEKEIDESNLEQKGLFEKEFVEEKKLDLNELPNDLKAMKALLSIKGTKVKVNVALPQAAQRASETNADGIGLLRAEHLLTESGMHPVEYLRQDKMNELIDVIKKGIRSVVKHFEGKQVWYRTFDARTDEYREMRGGEKEPKEDNPMLGWHGIRRSLDEPNLIKSEFIAIKELRKEGFTKIGVMLPFVQNVDEVRQAKKLLLETGLKLEEIEFGVMIETPAACWIIDDLIAEGINFISFGTNDLTQLTLGLDRNNALVQKYWNEQHPAVMKEISHVIERCKKSHVETSICGQAGSNPEMVKKLVRLGISSVSANIDAVKEIRKVVIQEENKMMLEEIRKIKKK